MDSLKQVARGPFAYDDQRTDRIGSRSGGLGRPQGWQRGSCHGQRKIWKTGNPGLRNEYTLTGCAFSTDGWVKTALVYSKNENRA